MNFLSVTLRSSLLRWKLLLCLAASAYVWMSHLLQSQFFLLTRPLSLSVRPSCTLHHLRYHLQGLQPFRKKCQIGLHCLSHLRDLVRVSPFPPWIVSSILIAWSLVVEELLLPLRSGPGQPAQSTGLMKTRHLHRFVRMLWAIFKASLSVICSFALSVGSSRAMRMAVLLKAAWINLWVK